MQATIKDTNMIYEEMGSGRAVVVLQKSLAQMGNLEGLSDAGFRVIVPGVGGASRAPQEGDADWTAEQIVTLLNYLGIGRTAFAVMPGHEAVIQALREKYPKRLAGAFPLQTGDNGEMDRLVGFLRSSYNFV